MPPLPRTQKWMPLLLLLTVGFFSVPALGSDKRNTGSNVGETAPDFTLPNLEGKRVSLNQFRGKTVILEWFNPDCPFVKNSHTQGVLQSIGNQATQEGHIWLAINSSAKGLQGHGVEVNKKGAKLYGMKYPILLDEDGSVGQRYEATRTPEIIVIDPQGVIVYRGAVDNTGSGHLSDADGGALRNYVTESMEVLAGKKVKGHVKTVKPYGCTIKYAR